MNILVLPYVSSLILEDVSGFVATVISYSEIDLTWINPTSAGFTGVEIYKHSSSLTSYDRAWCNANATLIYSGTNESYNNTGLDAETTYFYKIFAVYADDTGSHYSLGVVTNATTLVQPVQEWENVPDSPEPLDDYPYELILSNGPPAPGQWYWLIMSKTLGVYCLSYQAVMKAIDDNDLVRYDLTDGSWVFNKTYTGGETVITTSAYGLANLIIECNYDVKVNGLTGDVVKYKTTP
jgi:hypothetical protein